MAANPKTEGFGRAEFIQILIEEPNAIFLGLGSLIAGEVIMPNHLAELIHHTTYDKLEIRVLFVSVCMDIVEYRIEEINIDLNGFGLCAHYFMYLVIDSLERRRINAGVGLAKEWVFLCPAVLLLSRLGVIESTNAGLQKAPVLPRENEQVAVMQESAYKRSRHILIIENAHPTRKLQVGV